MPEKMYELLKPLRNGTRDHEKGALLPESAFGPQLAEQLVEMKTLKHASKAASEKAAEGGS